MTHFGIGMRIHRNLIRTAATFRWLSISCLVFASLATIDSPRCFAEGDERGTDSNVALGEEDPPRQTPEGVEFVSRQIATSLSDNDILSKRVIGAVSPIQETLSEIQFVARVDTGATTCSMHVEEWHVEDAAESMVENVGKPIRFRIKNRDGKSEWLERKIAEVATIKTSEREEQRYKVYLTLECNEVSKRVLVSLNDRSHMTYPVLIGRNFLEGDFLVDVSLGR